jgi:hypothetical protein
MVFAMAATALAFGAPIIPYALLGVAGVLGVAAAVSYGMHSKEGDIEIPHRSIEKFFSDAFQDKPKAIG